jgi:hypothetical protein
VKQKGGSLFGCTNVTLIILIKIIKFWKYMMINIIINF